MRTFRAAPLTGALALLAMLSACQTNPQDSTLTGPSFTINPCVAPDTVRLAAAQAIRADCTNGGSTLTLAGNGASYLIVAQFATGQGVNDLVPYTLSSGTVSSASASVRRDMPAPISANLIPWTGTEGQTPYHLQPGRRQREFEAALLARGRSRALAGQFRAALSRTQVSRTVPVAVPAVGSIRGFKVLSGFSGSNATYDQVGARLAYVGTTLLLYVDTLSLGAGFTDAQLQHFGQYFDQVMVPIDTTMFGSPSDIDQNGHVIMLMTPTVNKNSSASTCSTEGFVAGFFDTDDFNGPGDPNSNQGEIFYSIAPDPNARVSCAHTVDDVDFTVPAVFLHELQHLINFSQHVIVSHGDPGASWLDEGLSIAAEEEGSLYYEKQCPPPACRTSPTQLFPDSSQSFVQGFFYDSYQYALLPDTASITLHDDGENGFSWRGGTWLLVRWLADQYGKGIYQTLERGPSDGVADIQAATGRGFPALFSDFGLSLYTDSLPGLPRSTAAAVDRFTSRNVKQMWARLYATSGGTADIPTPDPVVLYPITTDNSTAVLEPGTMSFFRLDTPAATAAVTIRFSQPGGSPFPSALGAQLAVFRLP